MKLTDREEAYHNGYKQGRFDELAEHIGRDEIKAKFEQENCPYCHGGEPLIGGDGSRSDDNYNCVYIDQNGRLQQLTDAMGYVVVDTFSDNDAKLLRYCPMCGRQLNEED